MIEVIRCSRSKQSGKMVFPEIPAESPAAHLYEPVTVSNQAKLYSFTTIHPNPKSGLPPFSLAYADFADQVRVFGRLDLPPDAQPLIGMDLCLIWREGSAGDGLPPYLLAATKR